MRVFSAPCITISTTTSSIICWYQGRSKSGSRFVISTNSRSKDCLSTCSRWLRKSLRSITSRGASANSSLTCPGFRMLSRGFCNLFLIKRQGIRSSSPIGLIRQISKGRYLLHNWKNSMVVWHQT